MSDIKKRLDLFRKTAKKAVPQEPVIEQQPESGDMNTVTDPARAATLDRLRNLISNVRSKPVRDTVEKPGATRDDILAELNRKPLRHDAPVRDHAPAPGAGLLEADLFEGPGQSIEDLIPGEYLETPKGPCFRVRTEYPWYYHQGNRAVSDLLDMDPAPLARLTGEPALAGLDYRKTLFFDTETTGLDTGAGVYIFLAGLGFFEERTFVVEQFFMRDFPEEPAVLDALTRRMSGFEYLVTYNGKTYDWPLLETRYAMNRLPLPIRNPVHLDLLHGTRRLFRYRLENCKLPSIEQGVLGFYRVDDLPGALLPERYFRYVRSRDARFIHQAFAHNAHDIVSMAAVLAAIIQLLDNPLAAKDLHAEDLYAVARLAEASGDDGSAVSFYTEALQRGLSAGVYADALQQLSLVHKRLGDWESACRIWRNMIQTAPGSGTFALIELAKYYEHHARDFDTAMQWAEAALRFLETGFRVDRTEIEGLRHRCRRIETKRRGEPWKPGELDSD